MTLWYVDTSAAIKLLVDEAESAQLAESIDGEGIALAACWLVETELRRAAHRVAALSQAMVTELLEELELFAMPVSIFRQAGLLPGSNLRSLDALHLSVAIRIGVDGVYTYDHRMVEAARAVGLVVRSPGEQV